MNLMEDIEAPCQVWRWNNENIYFKSWKNSYVGAILKEIYVDRIYDWFFKEKKDLVVLDIGANIGLFTQYARRYAKRIIVVEPSTESFNFLERAKRDNRWDNVDLVKAALSDRTAHNVPFFDNQVNTTMRSLNIKMSDGSPTESVATLTMPDLFRQCHIERVDFMKLDVEGSELDIVKSDGFKKVLPFIHNIEIEVHLDEHYKNELFKVLKGYGLKITRTKTLDGVLLYIVTKHRHDVAHEA